MKVSKLLLLLLCVVYGFNVLGQCAYDNTYLMDATPSCPGTFTVNCMDAGEYVNVGLTAGNMYTITTCGSNAFDSQLTMYDVSGSTVYGYNDDDCGLQSTLSFVATGTGAVHILLDRYNCNNNATGCMDLIITCEEPVSLDSSNLPIVVINTAGGATIPDEPKIDATMGIIYNGEGVRNYMTDPFNEFDGNIGIEVRGSSSQMFPKKQWSIETRDNFGNRNDVTLFNMAYDNDWVLYAPYSDKSLIRNVLAYEMGRDLGGYSPRTQLCEVMLNGEYQGVYVLTEKIKRKDGKVGTNDVKPQDISGNELTGDYVIKVDKTTGGGVVAWSSPYPPYTWASQDITFQLHDPPIDSLNATQQNYIENYVTNFESALNGPNYTDPVLGYEPYIDVNSFIDFLLVNEASHNVDGYRISSYLHKIRTSEGGKLFAGPLWDFNLAFGNADYCNGSNTSGWEMDFYLVCGNDNWQNPFWWRKLTQDANFNHDLNCKWQQMRMGAWHTDSLMARIDTLASYLDESQQRNFQRWQILGSYVWPNDFIGNTYAEEIDYIKTWITDRMNWLDANMFGSCADLGVEEEVLSSISVYPNPGKEDFYFTFDNSVSNAQLDLLDVDGKLVHRKSGISGKGCDLHVEGLDPGLYYYKFDIQGKIVTGKLMIQ